MSAGMFYLQDSRSYVGNDILFWAEGGRGYTTDLSKAALYSREDAQRMHESRPSDIPWPKDYIDQRVRPAVDMQCVKRDEALAGSGIVLVKPPKPQRAINQCHGCGRFLSLSQLYSAECPGCGADNRP